MQAFVYKSLRKPDAYLYLREKDAFALVPDAVRLPLGALEFVLVVELIEGRKLARADVAVVRSNLIERGFYLQAPQTVLDPLVEGGVGDG
ncbi:MAG TPA: YcgL domain-containing protein [Arenimonas sp.]|uniref:YcgL domain-containing protein n=1 Tax=Arenimonas sp. TaxID=1872635 RepID=UPI002C103A50|nr:YcgL domain-containing protein [Arenimonas sp.]HMB56259.1 YcgL domain-containing protein [Arenimonas sp.]